VASFDYDIAFIGAGPGGYTAAIRARQLGLKTVVVEKDKPGGVCLNIGCIPSKALIDKASKFRALEELSLYGVKADLSSFDYGSIHSASRTAAETLSRGVDFLLKKNGVELVRGEARVSGSHELAVKVSDGGLRTLSSHSIAIASGSRPRIVPGFEFDEDRVLSSTGALMMKRLPKRIAILGAGAIGMEFAYILNSFGVEVTVIEMLDRILPMEDADAAAVARKAFEERGVRFLTGFKAFSLDKGKGSGPLSLAVGPSASSAPSENIEADAALVSIGREPNTDGLDLEKHGVVLNRSFVETGPYYETAAAGIYAIGDVVLGEPQLAHVASAQGEIVVERVAQLLGKGKGPDRERIDLGLVPSAVYCIPQLAGFGPREDALKAAGTAYRASSFPFRGVGKAVAAGEPEGFVKILWDPVSGGMLGASLVGAEATELVHELLLAKKAELLAEDVFSMVHAHPTLSEAVKEAALASEGRALHI